MSGNSCKHLIVAKLHHMATQNLVDTGPGNGLLRDGTKPLPDAMLTNNQWDSTTT